MNAPIKSRQQRIEESRKKEKTIRNRKTTGFVVAGTLATVTFLGAGLHVTGAFSNVHTVQKGDTLYSLSKRYDTTVKEIKAENSLSSNKIIVGQKLDLPDSPPNYPYTYTIQKGDTIFSISQKQKVSVDELKRANNLSSNLIFAGQKIKVPNEVRTSEFDVVELTPLHSRGTYTVQKGDTIFSIAKNYYITVSALKEANGLTSDTIYLGQKLAVPTDMHHRLAEEMYTVQPGDTLWGISHRFGVSAEDLKSVNNLGFDRVLIGQLLVIPGESTSTMAEIIGVSDRFTAEFKIGNENIALKIPYGTADFYTKKTGQTVFITYKNGAVINFE